MYNIIEETKDLEKNINIVYNYFDKSAVPTLCDLDKIIFISDAIYSGFNQWYFSGEGEFASYVEDSVNNLPEDQEESIERACHDEGKETVHIAYLDYQDIQDCLEFNTEKDMEEVEEAVKNLQSFRDRQRFGMEEIELNDLVEIYTRKMIEENANQLKIELANKDTGAKRKITKL